MAKDRLLRGIIPPIVTCLNEDETVDVTSQRGLVRYLLEGGVHGIFALGSMGEGVCLTTEERERCVGAVLSEVSGRVPVLAACSDTSTKRAIESARVLQDMGVDVVVCTVPFYNSPDRDGIVTHYLKLADAVSIPVMLYDLPTIVKTKLPRDVVLDLAKDPRILGVKDSSGTFNDTLSLMANRPKDRYFPVFQGWDGLVAPTLLMGGEGAVPGLSSVIPNFYVRMYDAAQRKDVDTVNALQKELMTGMTDLYSYGSGVGSIKAALSMMGIAGPTVSSPIRPAGEAEFAKVRAKLVEAGLIGK